MVYSNEGNRSLTDLHACFPVVPGFIAFCCQHSGYKLDSGQALCICVIQRRYQKKQCHCDIHCCVRPWLLKLSRPLPCVWAFLRADAVYAWLGEQFDFNPWHSEDVLDLLQHLATQVTAMENLILANVVTLVPMLLDAVKHYSDRGLSCSDLQVTSIFRHDTSNIGMGFLRLCCWETLFLVVNPQTASQTCTGEDNWWSEADAWLQGSWCCMRKLQVNRPES